MKKTLLVALLAIAPTIALAQQQQQQVQLPPAQQPSQEETALITHFQDLQQSLQVMLRIEQVLRKTVEDDEAQKQTLIDWLKASQAETAAAKGIAQK